MWTIKSNRRTYTYLQVVEYQTFSILIFCQQLTKYPVQINDYTIVSLGLVVNLEQDNYQNKTD